MNAILVCLAVATLGVDVGWRRLPDGGMEYIIEIEPQTLDALRAGESIQSDIPSSVRNVRGCRIMVGPGKKPLPHETPPESAKSHSASVEPPLLSTSPPVDAAPTVEEQQGSGRNPQSGLGKSPAESRDPSGDAVGIPRMREGMRRANPVGSTPSTFVPSMPDATSTPEASLLSGDEASRQTSASDAPWPSSDVAANMKPAIDDSVADGQNDGPAKPWLPLTFTLLGLFASLGGNIFLVWVVWDLRSRCRALLSGPFAERSS